jgi:dolichol-phosphate mannosyltransferase
MHKVSIIIPTYNEANNLPLLVEEIMASIDKEKIEAEIIIVDDNSPDGTGQVAEELSARLPVRVIHRAGKLGLGSAVIEGFKLSERSILGVMDGDMSHDPAVLNDMILSLSENDIAIGSRFEKDSEVQGFSLVRKSISKTGIFLTKFLTGTKDALSGYFFLKRDVIEGVGLSTVGYKILLEILVKGRYNKLKEFSYIFRMRKYSTSKLNHKEFLMFLGQIVKYSIYKLRYGK